MKPKFRAWDIHKKKMFTNDQLIIWDGNVYANDNSKLNVDNLKGWNIDEKYLMQTTGLKDKNGKEIYDGDIVRFTLTDGFNYVVEEDGAATYKLGAFYVANGLGEYLIGDIDTNDIEVIGDIYETPELLEENE
ncbi:hypothetical protein Si096_01496 [Streptococcus infantarius subsp. infantarius]|nr:hypothetical protein [Streptococcus infantarius subsp. infantarius]MCO4575764.1 hypothetical protein [Streptococcus infantarius subsp. infantarius]